MKPNLPERQVLSMDEFFRKALAAKQKTGPGITPGSVMVRVEAAAKVEPDPANDRRMTFTVMTANENRNGWQLNQKGWHLDNYAKNPVMLWAHNDGGGWSDTGSHGLPFARAERVWVENDLLKVECAWVDQGDITGEAGELCESVLRLYRKGYLNAVSAGWIPLDWEFVETDAGWKIMCKEQELVEISFVPVGADPDALREAARLGINVAPLHKWARSILGEPRYVMHASKPMDASRRRSLCDQFAEFYPGAKLLIVEEGRLGVLDDLAAVRQFTDEEFEEQVAAVQAGTIVTAGVVPKNVSTELAPKDATWSAPALSDFTDGTWADLTEAEKRKIAGHYAFANMMPPDTFGDLKLPHHEPHGGKVVWKGCTAAMSRLMQSGTDIPHADLKRVYDHLAKHYKDFGEEPPEFHYPGASPDGISTAAAGTPAAEAEPGAARAALDRYTRRIKLLEL